MVVNAELKRALRLVIDETKPLKVSTLYALSGLSGEDLQAVKEACAVMSPERRREMVRAMVDFTETAVDVQFTPVLRHCLDDADAQVRRMAIEGLWEVEQLWLVGALVHMLEIDPEVSVRAAAAASLGRFVLLAELGKIPASVGARAESALLSAYLGRDEPLEVRRRALEAVAYSGEVGIRDLIEEAYYEGEEDLRLSALFAMGRSADRFWRDVVVRELGSDLPAIRYEAAVACGELELRDAVSHLARLVEDEDEEVRSAAVEALGKIGGRAARQVLGWCCSSGDAELCLAAAEALEQASWFGDGDELSVQDDWTLAEP